MPKQLSLFDNFDDDDDIDEPEPTTQTDLGKKEFPIDNTFAN